MKKLLILCLLEVISLAAFAGYWDDEIWTNGSETLCTAKLNSTQVLVTAYGYSDAGYGYLFEISDKGKGNFDITQIGVSQIKSLPQGLTEFEKSLIDNDVLNSVSAGTKWKRRTIGNYELLLRYDERGNLTSAYVQTGREMSEVGEDAFQDMLVGQYTNPSGKRYAFATDVTCTWRGQSGVHYEMTIDGEYGNPSCHFTIDGQLYEFEVTKEGINIYNAIHIAEAEGPIQGEMKARLTADPSTPRWAFLSEKPLLHFIASEADPEVARLMRNEIFARHGYRFNDPKLRAYFEACSWYKPAADNSKIKLTDMEQLNVEILKNNAR